MKKLRVEYSKEKCIGNGTCVRIDPNDFKLVDGKAILVNSTGKDEDTFFLEKSCEDDEAKKVIEAAKGCPVNAITVLDVEKNEEIVGNKVNEESVKEIIAEYDDAKEFVLDPKGYFLIRINKDMQTIEVAFCNELNKILFKVVGKKPIDIYHTIFNKENLVIRLDHAAYLGRELQKAYIALKNSINYVQDDDLDFGNNLL